MKKFLRRFLIVMLVILVIIQFIRPAKNLSATSSATDISIKYPTPDSVLKILQVACYDCHSNNSRYPWYAAIQPVNFWMNGHIADGKSGLNFSEFAAYPIRKQYRRMDDLAKEVKEGGMPLPSYLWIHNDARLTDSQKNMLITWATSIHDDIKTKYPPDSLANKTNQSSN